VVAGAAVGTVVKRERRRSKVGRGGSIVDSIGEMWVVVVRVTVQSESSDVE